MHKANSNDSHPSIHSEAPTSPEKEPPATVFSRGEAAEDALLHSRTLHHYASMLARPRHLRLDTPLKISFQFFSNPNSS
ncbi:hypothetical protein L6164_023035 [Bauhinia variegata]|uniref:Uncharacterized protein n=1 Tax=Bauhinia variegata TaxID=167791 RepID=A0ACB9MGX3_BAUVA|nr:hypothetical protein L6164_023035 [Bauhinia variegata]